MQAIARKKLRLRQCPWLNYLPRYIYGVNDHDQKQKIERTEAGASLPVPNYMYGPGMFHHGEICAMPGKMGSLKSIPFTIFHEYSTG